MYRFIWVMLGLITASHATALSCVFNPRAIASAPVIEVVKFTEVIEISETELAMNFDTIKRIKGSGFTRNQVVFNRTELGYPVPTPLHQLVILPGEPEPTWGVCSQVLYHTPCKEHELQRQLGAGVEFNLPCEARRSFASFLSRIAAWLN